MAGSGQRMAWSRAGAAGASRMLTTRTLAATSAMAPAKTLSRPGVEQMDAIASSTEPRIVADTRESAGEPSAIAGTANRNKALSTIASSSYSPQSDAARLATVRRRRRDAGE